MKKLGFGLMRLPLTDPDNGASINMPEFERMIDAFIANGYTYFDTAWMYHDGFSEKAVKTALMQRHPRESFTLTTKLHGGYVKSFEDRDRIFNEQLNKTGAEYFDYYLLHAIGRDMYENKYLKFDCFNWLREKKRMGLVKHIGFSFHDSAAVLDRILTEQPDMEFVQLQLNFLDWESEGVQSRLCYEVACKHGVPVIVMEPVKGGILANLPHTAADILKQKDEKSSPAAWALRFAGGLDNVYMVLSGMSNMQQLEENMALFDELKPLNDEEKATLERVVSLMTHSDAISCTACSYCTDGCPKNIAIPKYFSLYNTDLLEREGREWSAQESYYENLAHNFGKADDCIECGQCESVCPQHLPITDLLKKVAKHFG